MNISDILISTVQGVFSNTWFVFVHGGWLILAMVGLWIAFRLYVNEINVAFLKATKWKFLQIRVEKENLQSLLAVEQIFTQLHAIQSSFTWAAKYLEGQFQLWLSMEIVSIGGKISYIIRVPEKSLNLAESAIYAQFPNAEITEVSDYMEHLTEWDPEESSWDLWGTEYQLVKDYAYPIKTYREFEHPISENKILDPLAGLLEAMSKAEAHELMAVQYCIRPIADNGWQPHVQQTVNKYKGVNNAVAPSGLGDKIVGFFDFIFKPLLGPPTKAEKKEEGVPAVQKLTEGEKRTLLAVETKMSKVAWETKIRSLYLAPKDKFDNTKRSGMIGAFRQLSGMTTNNLKPDTAVMTGYNYKVFKALEKPYTDWKIAHKKHNFLDGYVNRSMWVGSQPMILNAEELATLYHFPLATTTTPPVERIEVKKGQPPANLPILG